jgi:hypothetical protein
MGTIQPLEYTGKNEEKEKDDLDVMGRETQQK